MAKLVNGKWKVDFRPEGNQGPRVQRQFTTKQEAQWFEAHVIAQVTSGKPWNPSAKDKRKLAELCQLWFDQHGRHLKDGERRLRKLNLVCTALGDPVAKQLNAKHFLDYRNRRKVEPKTLNNELGYINAVFNELRRTNQIDYENPFVSIRPIKIAERELTRLTAEQILELLDSIDSGCDNPHVQWIARVCLATGAYWGEAEGLQVRSLRNGAVHFTDTKSGRNRSVPIDADLFNQVKTHLEKHQVFSSSITAFRRSLDRCSFTLPRGQASHVLRHSFASHFMMAGGNILTLQKILGHASITMTMRYAHLAPEHLREAIALNPLNLIEKGG